MNKMIYSLLATMALTASVTATATQYDWQATLSTYKDSLTAEPIAALWVDHVFQTSMAATTCAGDIAITGATAIADTVPVTNIISETLANMTDPSYQTFDANESWMSFFGNVGRGTLGGGVIGVADTLQFIVLWLGGNGDDAYKNTLANYQSTIDTANTLFAKQGECMMSMAKEMLVMDELEHRGAFGGK